MSRPDSTPHGGQSARRRLSAIAVDQAVAGGSNVLIAVLAARILDPSAFGVFGIVFLAYTTVQVSARAVVGEPLLSHPREARDRVGEVLGAQLVLGVVLFAAVALGALAGYAWDARLGESMLVLAACMPLLALQDSGRYLAFALRRPGSAVALDVLWLALQVGAIAVLVLTDSRTIVWFIAAWAGAGAVAGLWVFRQHRSAHLRPGLAWLRTTWSSSWRFLLAALATTGAALVGYFSLGVVGSAAAVGAVVGAGLLVRPFMTVQIAVVAAAVGEVAHGDQTRRTVMHHVRRASVVAAVFAGLNAVVVLALPDALGRLVLGDTWENAEPLLLPVCLQAILIGLMTGPRSGLLGVRAVRPVLRIDLAAAGLLVATCLGGALANGALGLAWAVLGGSAVMTIVWWVTVRTHVRDLGQGIGFGADDRRADGTDLQRREAT